MSFYRYFATFYGSNTAYFVGSVTLLDCTVLVCKQRYWGGFRGACQRVAIPRWVYILMKIGFVGKAYSTSIHMTITKIQTSEPIRGTKNYNLQYYFYNMVQQVASHSDWKNYHFKFFSSNAFISSIFFKCFVLASSSFCVLSSSESSFNSLYISTSVFPFHSF